MVRGSLEVNGLLRKGWCQEVHGPAAKRHFFPLTDCEPSHQTEASHLGELSFWDYTTIFLSNPIFIRFKLKIPSHAQCEVYT